MTNPLLDEWTGPLGTPDFAVIRADQFLPAIEEGIRLSRAEIAAITDNSAEPDFDNTVAALERSGAVLARVRRMFWMLSSAEADAAIHAIEAEVSARLTAWGTEVSHNDRLFARIAAVWKARESLTPEQARLVDNSYKGFLSGGAALDTEAKRRLAEINARLGVIGVAFGHNVLSATNGTELIVDHGDAAGIPEDLCEAATLAAEKRGLADQLLFRMDRGTYESLLTFADNRTLRERVWRAFTSRCQSGDDDNYPIIAEAVALRAEKARLLGYGSYADFALEDSMARTPEAAAGLMNRVWRPALVQAKREASALQELIDRDGGDFTLAAWDWRYFADKVRRERYSYDAGEVRSHLSLGKVRAAAFAAAERLYGLRFTRRDDISVYHHHVCAWAVDDAAGAQVGVLFTDYLARPEKHGGAWMGSLRVQEKLDGPVLPIVYTVANFVPVEVEDDALLTLDEARTLFHEFGHALHGLLSNVTYPSLAGTAVARDFVEFPSKLMEHWVASPEALRAAGIPEALAAAIERAESFGQGFATIEFLASAIVDLKLHQMAAPPTDIAAFETQTLADLGSPDAIGMRHRLAVFTHVFDGGYASAYYSYLWAEVLDADVFEAFTATGNLFDPELADRLRREVLAKGDARDPMQSFIAFRGREPDEAALLRARRLA